MVWSCDEKRGRKLHEKNYDSRGQWTPQSRTTEEAMFRHHTARHEVSPIKERTYCCSKRSGEEGFEWLTSPLRGINTSRKEICKSTPKALITLMTNPVFNLRCYSFSPRYPLPLTPCTNKMRYC